MKKINAQKGFTLIELVVVLVILGILAAVAVPKFINITADARFASIKGALGGLQSAMSTNYAEELIDGTESTTPFGYPEATQASIEGIMSIEGYTFGVVTGVAPAPDTVTITQTGSATAAACFITYTPAADKDTPATAVLTGSATVC